MSVKFFIECLFLILAAACLLFGGVLVLTENFCQCQERKRQGIELLIDCCFVGLNVGFVCFAALVPAWLIAVVIEWFERW